MRAHGCKGNWPSGARPRNATFPERPKDECSSPNTGGRDCMDGERAEASLQAGPM